MASSSYDTGRVAERCTATKEPFKPGDPFVAALFEMETGEGFERRDFTPAAWESVPKSGLFASWRGVTPDRRPPARAVIDLESFLGLFEQLGEADDPKHRAFRYVLALILLRKRALLPAGSREARGERPAALLVRLRGTSPESAPIEVIDPSMDESVIAEMTEQLRTLLRIER
jgi:hypothetical protein